MFEVEVSCKTGFVTVKVDNLTDATETIINLGKKDKDNSLSYSIKPIKECDFVPLKQRLI